MVLSGTMYSPGAQGITKVNCTVGSKHKLGTGYKDKYTIYEMMNISFVQGNGDHVAIGG